MSTQPAPTPADPLRTSAQFVKGVGPGRLPLFERLGLATVGDMLFFLPRSYEDVSDRRPIAQLSPGAMQTAIGEVIEIEGRETSGGRELLSIVIDDASGQLLEGVWFNQSFMARKFRFGQRVAFSGKPQWRMGHWQMNKPRVRFLDAGDAASPRREDAILPVYSLTEGITAEQMRTVQRNVAEKYAGGVADVLPPELRKRHRWPTVEEALIGVHRPNSLGEAQRGRQRLVYEEFLILQLALALKRRENRRQQQAPALPVTQKIDEHVRRLFPFDLTRDQNRAIVQICRDMARDRPMQRLLQADVGAGKTAVAVYALLLTVAHKHQAALMAPTEVLARQHWRTVNRYLEKSRVRRLLLTGALKDRERKTALGEIRMGQVDLVVGTQALIQKDVEFAKLGLVVIDEQHRFGVAQRAQFRKLGLDPHYLIMTATPIPRTMALTVFGDLDVSIIREMPPGRKPVRTTWVPEDKRAELFERLANELREGRQLFVTCPLVEESAASDVKAAEQTFKELTRGVLAECQVGLLHGRMDDRTKDQTMERFRTGELQALVTTTVIEVGVDVPNATLMVIEHADRFGLSQLHQLRGRVSRGPVAGECYLFAQADNEDTTGRLRLFCRTRDGFVLAEEDARLRGFGQFFGTRQHGLGELRLGNLMSDGDLLTLAREDAFAIVADDPSLRKPEHEGVRQAVLAKYGTTLDLARIG